MTNTSLCSWMYKNVSRCPLEDDSAVAKDVYLPESSDLA